MLLRVKPKSEDIKVVSVGFNDVGVASFFQGKALDFWELGLGRKTFRV